MGQVRANVTSLKCHVILHNYNLQTVSEDGNVTVSFIQYSPKASHYDNILICRGYNDQLAGANSKVVEDHHKMEIYCK